MLPSKWVSVRLSHFERSSETYPVQDGVGRRHRSDCAAFGEVMIFSHCVFESLRVELGRISILDMAEIRPKFDSP